MTIVITTRIRVVALALFVSLVAAQVHPMAGLIAFATVALVLGLIRDRASITHPAYIMTALAGVYFVLGGLNISNYRGEISEEMHWLSYWFVIALVAGCTSLDLLQRREVDAFRFSIPTNHLIVASIPGAMGLAWIAMNPGFPLIFPDRFTDVPAKAFFLAETLFVPFILVLQHCYSDRDYPAGRRRVLVASLLFVIALPGYRGWPIIAVLCLGLLFVLRNPRRILLVGLGLGLLVVVLISGLSYYRRLNNPGLVLTDIMLKKAGAEDLGTVLGLLHVALRESVALSQGLIEQYMSGQTSLHPGDSLFLSDFLSMQPGDQVAGGSMVASAFGDKSGVGLTPGALGALVYEFGFTVAFAVAALLGMTVAHFYRRAKAMASPGFYVLYFLIVIYSAHYLHRGIPKPSYVLIPAMAIIVLNMSASATRRLAADHQRSSNEG